jgi:CheY-like chemotaxis protein
MNRKPFHFLLIEDDEDHAELITANLMVENGVAKTIERVRDGEQALACLRRSGAYASRRRVNVVLLDLTLPTVNGHRILSEIKSDPELRITPVVVLTASRSEEDKARAYASHANSYLIKPADSGELSQMIRDLSAYWSQWNQQLG